MYNREGLEQQGGHDMKMYVEFARALNEGEELEVGSILSKIAINNDIENFGYDESDGLSRWALNTDLNLSQVETLLKHLKDEMELVDLYKTRT